jgi:ubiquinone/menaquinone biosynthesis C-methylase UbiE
VGDADRRGARLDPGDGPVVTDPAVPADAYDEAYYLGCCAGYETWATSEGREQDALYVHSLRRAGLRAGDLLIDIGTGRGEVPAAAAAMGARAIGVDYSLSAMALARKTLDAAAAGNGAGAVMAADARRLPLPSGRADLVTMLDVVEHLTPDELQATLVEARRVLRPGGRIFAHTLPTRTVYEVTYRLQRLLVPGRRRQWPADPRNDFERLMHVNEQTRRSLGSALRRAGFADVGVVYGQWVHDTFVPERHRRLYRRLARHRLTARFGVADLWAEARRP